MIGSLVTLRRLVIVSAATAAVASVNGQTRYEIRDAGVEYGSVMALSVNSAGDFVGTSSTPHDPHGGGIEFAFRSSSSGVEELNAFGRRAARSRDFNDAGEILGFGTGPDGRTVSILWRASGAVSLRADGDALFQAAAMDDTGLVIGTLISSAGQQRVGAWRNGQVSDWGTVGGAATMASAVNDRGVIAGTYGTAGAKVRVFIGKDGVLEPLAAEGAAYTTVTDIDGSERVVGYQSDAGDGSRATMWWGDAVVDLGSLGGQFNRANAINDEGTIVGYSDVSTWNRRGFVYRDGSMTDLSTLLAPGSDGWIVTNAYDIAENGTIIATAQRNGRDERVVILRPVPEPASMVVLGLGLAAFRARRRSGVSS